MKFYCGKNRFTKQWKVFTEPGSNFECKDIVGPFSNYSEAEKFRIVTTEKDEKKRSQENNKRFNNHSFINVKNFEIKDDEMIYWK